MTKIAIIADIHHGTDRGSKKGSAAAALFEKFLDWAHAEKCDLIADLGDRISDIDAATDFKLQEEVSSWFRKSKIPIMHVNGNHDVDFLSQPQLADAMGKTVETASLEIGEYNLLFWCGSAKLDPNRGFIHVSEAELNDLAKALSQAAKPTILFSHVPLNNPGFTGNYYFERIVPHIGSYPPEIGRNVREIIERSERVVLCINGHVHWNSYQAVDGIHYFSVPSLIETFTSYPEPNAAWSLLTLNGPDIRLKVFGNTPIEYSFPIKQPLNHHWLNVDKAYSPAKINPA